ncbi:hypothetical protein [Pseudoxanthomonas mexicana]
MPVYSTINGSLVTQDEYLARIGSADALDAPVALNINGDGAKQKLVIEPGVEEEFTEIGIGKPLAIWITSAYAGTLPPKGFRKKGCLVTSAVKSWNYQNAKPRALNAIKKSIDKNKEIEFSATEPGTRIAFYSPSLVDEQLEVTIEMAFDDIDEDFYSAIGDILTSAGSLPVFASTSTYLLAAGALFKIGGKIANGLKDNEAEFSATSSLNFDNAGDKVKAGYRLITRNSVDKQTLEALTIKNGKLVEKASPNTPYSGDIPHVVVAIDGARKQSLKDFAAQAASANLLQRFYNIRENGQTQADSLIEALKLFNDARYRDDAQDILDLIATGHLSDEEKAKLQARYEAIIKNIGNKEFIPKQQAVN